MSHPPLAGLGNEGVPPSLQTLFHRLNNQLGVVLANAELLEVKAEAATDRVRASEVVGGTLAALVTVRELRQRTSPSAG